MAIRTALLNWNNINRDTDFSKYIETVSEAGVIEWLAVTSSSVAIWKARVSCERTNGDTIYVLVYLTTAQEISWNWDVYIEVSQSLIDNGELANEDWTGIATINVWTLPNKNALLLATISSWVVTDERNMIPTVWELSTQINSLFSQVTNIDERVEALEEADAIDHLEESWLVWELYTLSDTLFKQYTPALADSTLDCNVSDVAANTQIHIQRIGSWVASNELKLKLKMVGSSTQNLKVEVREWVQVTVTANSEAYWYWSNVIASGSIPYSSISSSYSEITVNLNNEFWWTKWQLLDVVLYMDTVNASNYYCVACDSTQYSEWFSYVSVNDSTRTRSKLMPYCISDGFAQSLLSKVKSSTFNYTDKLYTDTTASNTSGGTSSKTFLSYQLPYTGSYIFAVTWYKQTAGTGGYFQFYYSDNTTSTGKLWQITIENTTSDTYYLILDNLTAWKTIQILGQGIGSSSNNKVYYTKCEIYKLKAIVPPTPSSIVFWYPNNVKTLWALATSTIYGKTQNNYIWGIALDKSTTATTGSIALGNAVGYITINFNGEIIKIPYYNE